MTKIKCASLKRKAMFIYLGVVRKGRWGGRIVCFDFVLRLRPKLCLGKKQKGKLGSHLPPQTPLHFCACCILLALVNICLVHTALGCGMVNRSSTEDHRGNWPRCIIHRSWKTYTACFEGTPGEVKVGCRQRESQKLGHMTLGLVVECFGLPRVREDESIQMKRVEFW